MLSVFINLQKKNLKNNQEEFSKNNVNCSALVEYNSEDDPKLEFVDYDDDIDEDKLNDILDEIDFDLEDERMRIC